MNMRETIKLLETSEIGAMIDWYTDGGCLTFAYAVHWMTGWPVMAVGASHGDDFLHFAPVSPDGLVWDAAGPRNREITAASYTDDPEWSEVDPYKFISTGEVSEDDITEACHAALEIFGKRIEPFVKRSP